MEINYGILIYGAVYLLDSIIMIKLMDACLCRRTVHRTFTLSAYGAFFLLGTAAWKLGISWQYGMCYLLLLFFFTLLYENSWETRIWAVLTFGSVRFLCLLIKVFAFRYDLWHEWSISVMLFLVCFLIINRLGVSFRDEEEADRRCIAVSLPVPLVSLAAMCGLLHYKDNIPSLFSMVCCIGILVMNLSVLFLCQIMLQNYRHIRQRDVYMQQTAYYRNQLYVIAESQNSIRSLRHDMKNHILHLEALLAKENCADARQYLNAMAAGLQSPAEYVSTRNEEIDSLLNYKIKLAERLLNTVDYRIHIPKDLEWQSFDNNVILGNLLDNAIEAAAQSERKILNLEIRAVRGMLLIHVANSYSGTIKREGALFSSTKEGGEHGIGLQNVRHMVEKQNGEIAITYSNGLFEVEVMLYINGRFSPL